MTYSLVFDEHAGKELAKLPKEISHRIYRKLLETKEDPYTSFERLAGRSDYKLRVGAYRIIADIDSKEEQVRVTKIGHRKNIYERG